MKARRRKTAAVPPPAGSRAVAGRRQLGSAARTATPLYHQMYLVLRQRIQGGEFDPAQPLPGEHHLAGQFGVSRVTVRRTLGQLEKDGLVTRRRGVGTFPVTQPAAMQDRYNVGGLINGAVAAGDGARITTLGIGMMTAPAHVAALFGSGAAPVLRIRRQRAIGRGEPFTLLTTWLPEIHAARLGAGQLRSAQTLVALEEAGVEIVRAEQSVTARVADEGSAQLLQVPVGSPLLAMTTYFLDRQDAPVALFEALFRPDLYEYRLTMLRRGSGRERRWQMVD